jgi:hypothetical protein
MNQTPPPTKITADEFRALLAKVNAPAVFVEEELERWRARGLIAPDPKPPSLVEDELAKAMETCEFSTYATRVPYMNGFRAGFKRAESVTQKNIVAWLLFTAGKAKEACRDEELKPDMGDVFWRRYWAGYFTSLENAAEEIGAGTYTTQAPPEKPTLLELEKLIANTVNSGNDITPYEIAVAVHDRFTNLVQDTTK